jgi:hypothetical protein
MMLNHVQVIRAESHNAALQYLKENPCDLVLYTLDEFGSKLERQRIFSEKPVKFTSCPSLL